MVVATVAILAVFGAAAGCSAPAPVPRDDLALGNDQANATKKKSGPSDSPEPSGTPVELGPGAPGTEPAPEPARQPGDSGDSNGAPSTCTMDAQCNQAGRICTSGACVKGCRTTPQCPINQSCVQGQCALNDASVQCTFDYDCVLGAVCVGNMCKAGCYASLDCPTGQTCSAGMCKVSTSTPPPAGATPCSSDGQCNPGVNGSGQICSAQGVCVAGCHRDNQCPGSKICVTGMCR